LVVPVPKQVQPTTPIQYKRFVVTRGTHDATVDEALAPIPQLRTYERLLSILFIHQRSFRHAAEIETDVPLPCGAAYERGRQRKLPNRTIGKAFYKVSKMDV
jgi:hypothetical protein